MKIKNILLAFFLTLISVSNVMPQEVPCPNCPPNKPDMPIDQNVVYLMGAALVLGVVMIYKNKIKKASV